MKLCYVAHRVGAPTREEIDANLAAAKQWYKRLCETYLDRSFTMNWVVNCEMFDETPENIEIGMRRNLVELARCDELFLVGPTLSKGMEREQRAFTGPVYNLIGLKQLPNPYNLELYKNGRQTSTLTF